MRQPTDLLIARTIEAGSSQPRTMTDSIPILFTAQHPERRLDREASRGSLQRLKQGAYCDAETWAQLSADARHLLQVRAFARSHPTTVFARESAALLLGLPLIAPPPDRVQAAAPRATGGRSEPGLQRWCRALADDEVIVIDGVHCTDLARTVADLALSRSFREAVPAADRALALGADLSRSVDRMRGMRGLGRVARVVVFADGRSESPGESGSRATIHDAGFPAPDLQVVVRTEDGEDRLDFGWRRYRAFGEFDGRAKYERAEYTRGRSAAEIVWAEKVREDRIRAATGFQVIRWTWSDFQAVGPLVRRLEAAGIPRSDHRAGGAGVSASRGRSAGRR